ncbi:MAG: hypothetical protein ACRDWI_03520 [Jiangellaceae bacterium]
MDDQDRVLTSVEDQERIFVAPDLAPDDALRIVEAAAAPPRMFTRVSRSCLIVAFGCAVVGFVGFLFPVGNAARNLQALLVVAFMVGFTGVGLALVNVGLMITYRRALRTREQERLLAASKGRYVDLSMLPWNNRVTLSDIRERVRQRWGDDPPAEVVQLLWQAAKANWEGCRAILRHRGNILGDPDTLERTWREAGSALRKLAEALSVDPAEFWDYDDEPDLAWCSSPSGGPHR